MTADFPIEAISYTGDRRRARLCTNCGSANVLGEPGWLLCRDCGWDECPPRPTPGGQ